MACRCLARSSCRPSAIFQAERAAQRRRLFSTTQRRLADDLPNSPATRSPPSSTTASASTATSGAQARQRSALEILTSVGNNLGGARARDTSSYGLTSALDKYRLPEREIRRQGDDEYHLHVYSHKHNTHLTLSDTDRKSIISISAGNLGFRKSQRGTYDAAYQLMAYLLSRIQQQGLMPKIQKLELCLRGFGHGREAVTKVLLGLEGTRLREAIVRVVDKTRLKIGGNRSPAPRRLG